MAQTEVGEVGESGEAGRGGSSTMPQKSNPITSELIVAAARTNAALLSALHQAQIQEHERATHGWQVEWLTLPQMVLLTGGALKHGALSRGESTSGCGGDARQYQARQRRGSRRGRGVRPGESAAAAGGGRAGEEGMRFAVSENKPLIEVVKRLAGDSVKKVEVDWQALADPGNYLGETEKIIDRVLKEAEKLLR